MTSAMATCARPVQACYGGTQVLLPACTWHVLEPQDHAATMFGRRCVMPSTAGAQCALYGAGAIARYTLSLALAICIHAG